MKMFVGGAVALACALLVSTSPELASGQEKKKLLCPVKGKAIKKSVSTEFNGGTVYFCWGGCKGAFIRAKGGKFAAKANHQMVSSGQFKQVKCPLKLRRLNPATKIEVSGVAVCFCWGGCKKAALRSKGAEQINLIFNDKNFRKAFTPKKKKAGE